MLHPDLVVNILRVAPVDFLWSEYCLLTKSCFYLELRNPHIVGELYSHWDIECKCKNITRFFLEFDKKYFLNFSYTTPEYRKDRVARGFGATRLFKLAFLQGIDLSIYQWPSIYLSKYYADVPQYIRTAECINISELFNRCFSKGMPDDKIIEIIDGIVSNKLVYYHGLRDTVTTFAAAHNRPNLQFGKIYNNVLARILDDPKLLDEMYFPSSYINCPNIIRFIGIDKIPGYVECSTELRDYLLEIGIYPSNICSTTVVGLKLLLEKGVDINLEYVDPEGALWLYKRGKITEDALVKILKQRDLNYYNPDTLLEIYEDPLCEKVKSLVYRFIS